MARLFEVLCLSAMVLLVGCTAGPREPQFEGVKIGELAPKGPRRVGAHSGILRTTNVDCVIFELPADKAGLLDGIWQILNTDSVRYNNLEGFAANGLRAAAGEYSALAKVNELLKSAGAQRIFTTALLIPDGQAEVINIGRLTRKTTISYIYRHGTIRSDEVGPAICGLQLTTGKFPGLRTGARPVASVQVVPVILASTEGLPPKLAAQLRTNDLRIYSAGFSVTLRPGDIVLLAPRGYTTDKVTAAGRFFTRIEPKPVVRVFLFVCTSIT